MEGKTIVPQFGKTSTSQSIEPVLEAPKTTLLRKSPRFDDSRLDVLYEDLGIAEHLPKDFHKEAGTRSGKLEKGQ